MSCVSSSVSLTPSHILKTAPDDPSTFDNAPIAVQLVGRTQEEEAVIGMAEIVDAALKN